MHSARMRKDGARTLEVSPGMPLNPPVFSSPRRRTSFDRRDPFRQPVDLHRTDRLRGRPSDSVRGSLFCGHLGSGGGSGRLLVGDEDKDAARSTVTFSKR